MIALLLLLSLSFPRAQARAATPSPPAYRITGVVVDAVSHLPVPRAQVSIFLNGDETDTVAGGDGQFAFEGLGPGKYQLYATAQGYLREAFDQHGGFFTGIAVGNGLNSEHLLFRLHRQAVIRGKVTDEHGEPVRHASVSLFNAGILRRNHPVLEQRAETNDLGDYRFPRLSPGKYYLVVQAQPWYAQTALSYVPQPAQFGGLSNLESTGPDPLRDVVYPFTFYPGVTDEHAAVPLDLAAGDTVEADLSLVAVPAVHVRLTNLPTPENGSIGLLARRTLFGTVENVAGVLTGQIGPGELELAGLPPGDVMLDLSTDNKQWNPHAIQAHLRGGDAIDAYSAAAGAAVSGHVILPAQAPSAEEMAVNLASDQNQSFMAKLQKDGAFSFPSVQAGSYEVIVRTLRSGQYIESVSASGARLQDRELILDGTSDVELRIRIGEGVGHVTGEAQLDGKPVAGVMVLLVPESGENLDEDSRMDQSDSDGTFSLPNVVPGKYVLMAIADGWDLEWKKPEILNPYLEKGQRIQIAPNESKQLVAEVMRKPG